jgi:hypothetical protein
MDMDDEETEEEMLARAIELSMQESDNSLMQDSDASMVFDDSMVDGEVDDGSGPDIKRKKTSSTVDVAIGELRKHANDDASRAAVEKGVAILVKLLANPLKNPSEPKYRQMKPTNKTIARVLALPGAEAILREAGFVEIEQEGTKLLKLEALDEAKVDGAVGALEGLLAEIRGTILIYKTATGITKSVPVSGAAAARTVVEGTLNTLYNEETPLPDSVEALKTFYDILFNVYLTDCRAIIDEHRSFAVDAMQRFISNMLHGVRDSGSCDLSSLGRGFRCLVELQPPGKKDTLDARAGFCADCLEALLPQERLMELKLRLVKGSTLQSAIGNFSGFSEAGMRAGIMRQVRGRRGTPRLDCTSMGKL